MLLAVRGLVGGTARMGHGFVSDPGQLTSLATTVYRLKQKYDAVTVSSQTEGEPLGAWTWRAASRRSRPSGPGRSPRSASCSTRWRPGCSRRPGSTAGPRSRRAGTPPTTRTGRLRGVAPGVGRRGRRGGGSSSPGGGTSPVAAGVAGAVQQSRRLGPSRGWVEAYPPHRAPVSGSSPATGRGPAIRSIRATAPVVARGPVEPARGPVEPAPARRSGEPGHPGGHHGGRDPDYQDTDSDNDGSRTRRRAA